MLPKRNAHHVNAAGDEARCHRESDTRTDQGEGNERSATHCRWSLCPYLVLIVKCGSSRDSLVWNIAEHQSLSTRFWRFFYLLYVKVILHANKVSEWVVRVLSICYSLKTYVEIYEEEHTFHKGRTSSMCAVLVNIQYKIPVMYYKELRCSSPDNLRH